MRCTLLGAGGGDSSATETLQVRELREAVAADDSIPLIFSLDLREGRPIVAADATWLSTEPLDMIGGGERAAASFRRVLIVDLDPQSVPAGVSRASRSGDRSA